MVFENYRQGRMAAVGYAPLMHDLYETYGYLRG